MARTIDPAEIGLDYAPCRRRDVTEVVQDGEALIYEPDGSGKHQLNWVATVLWHCIDGSVTLRQLSADLGEVLGTERALAEAEVCAYTRALGELGLLIGVRRTADTDRAAGTATGDRAQRREGS